MQHGNMQIERANQVLKLENRNPKREGTASSPDGVVSLLWRIKKDMFGLPSNAGN